MTDHDTARVNMVENQLRPNRVVEPRLLEAMGAVPRELFVPAAMRGVAYADEDVPIGGARFLVEPWRWASCSSRRPSGPATRRS
jgi:protein-L-isoaspartate(D-aspartate) O-methyltransferase